MRAASVPSRTVFSGRKLSDVTGCLHAGSEIRLRWAIDKLQSAEFGFVYTHHSGRAAKSSATC